MRTLRAGWRLLRAVLHAAHGVVVVLVLFPRLELKARRERIRWWAGKMLRVLGIGLQVDGLFRPGAKLLVANHVSWIDIMVIHAVCPEARFVSKAEVQQWPLVGRLVDAAQTLYLERERKRDALRVVHQMAAQALINLALMAGQIGRPGTGANSITGQCNAMGSRLFGNATSLLGGYDFANAAHRAHVASVLGIDAALIPTQPSRAYDRILDAVGAGEIRALWIVATNTAHSWINQGGFAQLRAKLDFLVVQEMYSTTETAQQADLVLPAAAWGEKDGFFINSERRLGLARKVARAPGVALSDFSIFKLIAEAWGCGPMFQEWSSPAATFQILKNLSRGQPCDFSGIRDHDHLEEAAGIQWPFAADAAAAISNLKSQISNFKSQVSDPKPEISDLKFEISKSAASGPIINQESRIINSAERRLFADGKFYTPDGRARFLFDEPAPLPEPPDAEYPFLLNTGRGSSSQWHTGSRTNKSAVLRKLAPNQQWVELNPADASRLDLNAGEMVLVRSRRGETTALAVVTPIVQPGQIFMPMHFAALNALTFPAYDPHSRQPAYKACAVQVRPMPPAL